MQDSISGVAGCTSSKVGRDLVWTFLQKNWTKLISRFGEKSSMLIAFVEVIARLSFLLEYVDAFFVPDLVLPFGFCR